MMNSMSNNELINDLKGRYNILNADVIRDTQIAVDLVNGDVHSVLAYLKSQGWRQLSILTNIDWIDEGKYQLVYIIFNWDNPIWVQVRTKIDRDNAKFPTITSVYPGAKYYERDVHEFFGVEFDGNPEALQQLFLEGWDDIPPLRKDFDAKAYSDKKYSKREYTTDFNTKEDLK